MAIAQLGAVNTAALNVPGVLVQIVPPSVAVINGVATNVLGVVGTATWGPVNSPYSLGNMPQQASVFGQIQARKYDLGTAVAIAVQQGAAAFLSVRVTDGTDTAANAALATVSSQSPAAPGVGYAAADNVTLTTGTVVAVTTTQLVVAPTVVTPGGATSHSYAPADTITLAGGTESIAAILTVATTQVSIATVNGAGTGGTNGTQIVTGTTGTGTPFQAVVTISGGAMTAVQYVLFGGSYTVNPTVLTAEPVTGGGLGGSPTLAINMGVLTTTVTTHGSYTVNGGIAAAFTQSVSSGSGTGATFSASNQNYGVLASSLTTAGLASSGSAVPQASTTGTGTGATWNLSVSATDITFTSIYTGSNGNNQSVTIAQGSNSTPSLPTWRVTLSLAGILPEVFDNIGGTGNAVYHNIANAVNLGQSGIRGPSQQMTASPGAGSATPSTGTFSLSGGTDGTTTITSATLIGSSGSNTGMYALSNSAASVIMLADADDSTKWSAQSAFGLNNGAYMIGVLPSGTSIASAVSTKQASGVYTYGMKIMHGDWCYWFDGTNNVQRLVSPQAVIAGKLGALSPQYSTLNQKLQGIVATQTSAANQTYSTTQLAQLGSAGIDVITNPSPGGDYFSAAFGRNSSAVAIIWGDNYTRMTNFLASTLNAGMGVWVGTLFSPTQAAGLKATIDNYFQNLLVPPAPNTAGMIAAFQTSMPILAGPGLEQVSIQVQYLTVVTNIVANLQGGESVTIASIVTTPV